MSLCEHRFDGSVYGFRARYGFLSNMSDLETPIVKQDPEGNDVKYRTVEHFFQAMKTMDWDDRRLIAAMWPPGTVKRFVNNECVERDDWESIKIPVMWHALRIKFSDANPTLKKKLLDTGDRLLIEANNWNDRFWGVDWETGQGENVLGRLLMKLRKELKEKENG